MGDAKNDANGKAKEDAKDNKKDAHGKTKECKQPKAPKCLAVPAHDGDEERPGGIQQAKRWAKSFMYRCIPDVIEDKYHSVRTFVDRNPIVLLAHVVLSAYLVYYMTYETRTLQKTKQFVKHADNVARSLSNPQVVYKAQQRDGS